MAQPLFIYGAGGLGREVLFWARRAGLFEERYDWQGFVVTDDSYRTGKEPAQEVVKDEAWLLSRTERVAVIIGIGNARARLQIGQRLLEAGRIDFPTLIDESVVVDLESCRIGEGATISPGCVITVDVRIGRFSHVNYDCTIGHDARIGHGCVLNPSVNVSGNVTIGDGVLVGAGATILEKLRVGSHSIIGGGALVNRDVAEDTTVAGVPARPIK